jgi:hypothetical protein
MKPAANFADACLLSCGEAHCGHCDVAQSMQLDNVCEVVTRRTFWKTHYCAQPLHRQQLRVAFALSNMQ